MTYEHVRDTMARLAREGREDELTALLMACRAETAIDIEPIAVIDPVPFAALDLVL